MSDDELISIAVSDLVVVGICVVLTEDGVMYAGPIKDAPTVGGSLVMLNPADSAKFGPGNRQ